MPDELLRVIDMHGQFAYWADEEEARRLFRMAYGRGHGTKKKLHSIHLVVPLCIAAEANIIAGRDLVSIARDRYHFKDRDVVMGWKLRRIPADQRRFFGPMTHPFAYRPPARAKAEVVTHEKHKKGRRRR